MGMKTTKEKQRCKKWVNRFDVFNVGESSRNVFIIM